MKQLMTLFVTLLILLTGCSQQADNAAFPQGNISMVIPYGAGGGFDTTVRVFAPYFAEQLGGGITVLPENIPGTGGRRGTATVYRAKPDGYTLGIFNLPGLVLPSVLGEKVDYELRELSWIGRVESQDYVLLVPSSSAINSIQDLQAQEKITFVSIGYGTTVLAAIQIMAEQLGLMSKTPTFLTGYSGTTDQLVALVRGDGNATLSPISTAQQYVQSGSLRPLAVTGDARSTHLPEVPTFTELGFPELAPLNVQRSIAGPPGMDPALLKQLRDAFNLAMADPEFVDTATKAQMDVAPLNGEEAAAAINENFTYYEKFKANLGNPNK
jgi:tripartite-type tricarboxylate transporter receptor subunit TctC